MAEQQPFKWRHFEAEIILKCGRATSHLVLSYFFATQPNQEREEKSL